MGKKVKVGKQRRDKYYQLAKESGYRARSAFKLVQLNRRFEFLGKCRVLVDLCAAPGGWCQVAAENMPMSSIIIGVDLVPIKAIKNVITLQNDITTDSCKQSIKKEMKTWLADCVLHDGAPNVGRSWGQDAFSQAQLTLSALKLATTILKKNGWFVTKVFRSKDYPALLTTFGELFAKVHATKPQASRNESAEIFVVCSGFKKPAKIDPALLDPKCVFKEVNLDPEKPKLNVLNVPEKTKKPKAEGYAEGVTKLYSSLPVSEFIIETEYIERLGQANQIVIDDPKYTTHSATTPELLACIDDVKVCGRRELKAILMWRKKLRHTFLEQEDMELTEQVVEDTEKTPEEQVDVRVDNQLNQAIAEEKAKSKRKKRKEAKLNSKRKERIRLGMIIPGDVTDNPKEMELFDLKRVNKASAISSQKHAESQLLVSLEDEPKKSFQERRTEKWFNSGLFEEMQVDEEDDEAVIDKILTDKTTEGETPVPEEDEEEPMEFEEVSQAQITEEGGEDLPRLDAVGMAIGATMLQSSKARRQMIESAFNRYMNNDIDLPAWFVDDERKNFRPVIPVTKELIAQYRLKQKALDARPIKKVAEAKARKRKAMMRKVLKAKKKAQSVSDNVDLSENEKMLEMKKIYKQAAANAHKKVEVKYVVAKKGAMQKRARRPDGVMGRYKVVDPRQKKDLRSQKKSDILKKKGKQGRKKHKK